MKNNKILYILTLIITLFSFNINVYAAQELTCQYKKEDNDYSFTLIQKSSGQRIIYTNTKESPTLTDPDWQENTNKYTLDFAFLDDERYDKNTKNLKKCPVYVKTSEYQTIGLTMTFFSDFGNFGGTIYTHALSVKTVGGGSSNSTTPLTCLYGNNKKIALIQESSGHRNVYLNANKDATLESLGWGKISNSNYGTTGNDSGYVDISEITERDGNNNLISCPDYVTITKDGIVFSKTTHNIFTSEKLHDVGGIYFETRNINVTMTKPTNTNGEAGHLIDFTATSNGEYTAGCRYKEPLDNGEYHYIQINYGEKKIMFSEYDPQKTAENGVNYSGIAYAIYHNNTFAGKQEFKLEIGSDFTLERLFERFKGNCPEAIMVERKKTTIDKDGVSTIIKLDDGALGTLYSIVENGTFGSNPLTGDQVGIHDIKIDFLKPEIKSCTDLLGEEIAGYLNMVWNIVKFGLPIMLLGLGTIDFAQAVFAGKDDGMKKAQEKFIKRVIIAVAIFLVPTLIAFLLKIGNSIWGDIGTDLCGIIF